MSSSLSFIETYILFHPYRNVFWYISLYTTYSGHATVASVVITHALETVVVDV